MHIPILSDEVIKYLDPKPGQNFIDATVGDGGHAGKILEKIIPGGTLIAIDRDPDAISRAEKNLEKFGSNVLFINDSFGNLAEIAKTGGIRPIDGILFDFGMSSSQLESSNRGFSFLRDEPLDMRFNPKENLTAAEIVNSYRQEELSEIFWKWGEEKSSRLIAHAIVEARRKKRIISTKDLIEIVENVKRREGKIHPATKIFQALRIEVNHELSEIEKAFGNILNVLTSGGRAAFISFHSLEDRLVKNWARREKADRKAEILTKKPVTPSLEEIKNNPKSQSAKLRAIEKI